VDYGVEPICRVLEIAPAAYDVYRQRLADVTRHAPRAQRDAILRAAITRIYRDNHEGYGVRKVW